MSNDHHEMEDEDMEEEGSISSIAWRGMNLREQIKSNARLIFKDIPKVNFEIYVTESEQGANGNASYIAFLMDVFEEPSGRSTTRRLLDTRDSEEANLQTPAQALYQLFLLTAMEAENTIREFL